MGIPVKERLGLLIFKFFVFMDIYFWFISLVSFNLYDSPFMFIR